MFTLRSLNPSVDHLSAGQKMLLKSFFDIGGLAEIVFVMYLSSQAVESINLDLIVFIALALVLLGGIFLILPSRVYHWKKSMLAHTCVYAGIGIVFGWATSHGFMISTFEVCITLLVSLTVTYAVTLVGLVLKKPISALFTSALGFGGAVVTLFLHPRLVPAFGMQFVDLTFSEGLLLFFLIATLLAELQTCLRHDMTIDLIEKISLSHFLTGIFNFELRGRANIGMSIQNPNEMTGWQKFLLSFSDKILAYHYRAIMLRKPGIFGTYIGEAVLVLIPQKYASKIRERLKLSEPLEMVNLEEIQEVLEEIRRRQSSEDQ